MTKPFSVRGLLICAFILQIVWGMVPSASQVVIQELPVELYIALRWSISGFIFAAYLILTRRFTRPAISDAGKVAILGVFGYGIGSLGYLYGLKIGGVTNFALMGALNPVITTFVAVLALGEKPRKIFYLALPLCISGLVFLVIGKQDLSSLHVALSSALLIIGAATLETIVFIYSKKFKAKVGTVEYLAIAQLSAAFFMWLLQVSVFHQGESMLHLSTRAWFAALFVSIIACVCCYAVLYWLLNFIDGHRLALFDGVHTLSASFFGFLLFHERLNWEMLCGGVLLLIGLTVGNLKSE